MEWIMMYCLNTPNWFIDTGLSLSTVFLLWRYLYCNDRQTITGQHLNLHVWDDLVELALSNLGSNHHMHSNPRQMICVQRWSIHHRAILLFQSDSMRIPYRVKKHPLLLALTKVVHPVGYTLLRWIVDQSLELCDRALIHQGETVIIQNILDLWIRIT